jgi:hypothetical protein
MYVKIKKEELSNVYNIIIQLKEPFIEYPYIDFFTYFNLKAYDLVGNFKVIESHVGLVEPYHYTYHYKSEHVLLDDSSWLMLNKDTFLRPKNNNEVDIVLKNNKNILTDNTFYLNEYFSITYIGCTLLKKDKELNSFKYKKVIYLNRRKIK